MATTKDLGDEALDRIVKVWQVDDDRVIWSDNGFGWWPGSYRVSVRVHPSPPEYEEEPEPAWRLVVRTSLAKDVDATNPEVRTRIALFAALSPTYAMVYEPPELGEKYPEAVDGTLWLQSSVYLRRDSSGYLPEFFARTAILQPIDAQRQGETIATMLHASPDESAPKPGGSTDHRDEMLTVADSLYVPLGKQASRWAGTGEFEQFAERFGRNDGCFGVGDPTGLTLETPFGENSTLIRLLTTEAHPQLGNGLVATLILPLERDESTLENECAWFNYFEATSWTGFPQLGSWTPKQHGEQRYSGIGFFLPNALYGANLAANAALWHLGRVRWIKNRFFSHLQDRRMADILKVRWKRMGLEVPE